MTQVAMGEIGELRAAMQGPVIAPGDPGFDEGRRVGTPRSTGVRR